MDVDEKKVDEIVHKCPEIVKELRVIEQKIMELRQALLKAIGEDNE